MNIKNKYLTIGILFFYIGIFLLIVSSYAFIDAGLLNFLPPSLFSFFQYYRTWSIDHRPIMTSIVALSMVLLFMGYVLILKFGQIFTWNMFKKHILICVSMLVLSFPAFTYDIFNYVTTAKILFYHHENPYITMPIEIENEPYLAFTRAANKVALYGPTWLLVSALPQYTGSGNIWSTMYAFKFMNAVMYVLMTYLIYRITKNHLNALFFAFNPLVVIETVVSGHNDIYMIVLAIAGLWMAFKNKRWIGMFLFIASIFVKGATIILTPLLFFRRFTLEKIWMISFWLMLGLFVVATPIREELYPWYAIWFLCFAALLPLTEKFGYIHGLSIALSIGLELRHIPYIAMGYYEGPGPLLRTVLTIIPVIVWSIWYISINRKQRIMSSI